MANLTHGMNVEEVKGLGRDLQAKKGDIENLVAQIEAKVNGAGWEGPDANRFKNEWWPEHRNQLRQIAEQIHGFGTLALNNASAQESASNA